DLVQDMLDLGNYPRIQSKQPGNTLHQYKDPPAHFAFPSPYQPEMQHLTPYNQIPALVPMEKLRLSTDNSIWERMEQLEMLIDIFPECDRSYLRKKCDECNGCATTLMDLVQDMLDLENYPRIQSKQPGNTLHQYKDPPVHFAFPSPYQPEMQHLTPYNQNFQATTGFPEDITLPGIRPPSYNLNDPEKAHPCFPSHWEPMPNDKLVMMVALDESSDEYKRVAGYLPQKLEVHRIERVQNPYFWEMYQNCRELFLRHHDRDLEKLNERYLWHGTRHENVPDICAKNLDWRYHGRCGAQAYGQGTYFSHTPHVSLKYAPPSASLHGGRCLLLVRVLVGKCAGGHALMKMPPSGCDTTVNNVSYPSIFVKYHDQEIYPEYVLVVKNRSRVAERRNEPYEVKTNSGMLNEEDLSRVQGGASRFGGTFL
ncbi:unnamed protein product, partial [Darwinula stevensoni]